jgi:hypothetical protein
MGCKDLQPIPYYFKLSQLQLLMHHHHYKLQQHLYFALFCSNTFNKVTMILTPEQQRMS